MKKIFFGMAAFVAACISMTAMAQEVEPVVKIDNTEISDNWYVGGQIGPMLQFNDIVKDGVIKDRPEGAKAFRPFGSVYVGKHFNPIMGARLRAGAGTFHTMNNVYRPYLEFSIEPTVDFTNLFAGFDNDRGWSLVGFGGVGYSLFFDDNEVKQPPFVTESRLFLTAGLDVMFELDYGFELGGGIIGRFGSDLTDNLVSGNTVLNHGWDYAITPVLDVRYNIGNTFEEAEYFDAGYVWGLNEEINNLAADKDELNALYEQEKARKNEVKEVTVEKTVYSVVDPAFVLFEIGRSDINQTMLPVLDAFVEYLNNTKGTVTLIGYADKATGTANFNYVLSEKRARAVADYFVEKGVAGDRIEVKFVGSHEQHFPVNGWNRAVIIDVE